MECLKSNSTVLPEIGLALLKFVSSHRGLTLVFPSSILTPLTSYSSEIFDEYTRRQYVAKAPERNPFGTEEEPAKFTDFDIFTKVGCASQSDDKLCSQTAVRSQFFSSLPNGPWATLIALERRWPSRRTLTRCNGYVMISEPYIQY
jgi:hypothetical protein